MYTITKTQADTLCCTVMAMLLYDVMVQTFKAEIMTLAIIEPNYALFSATMAIGKFPIETMRTSG